MVVQTAALLKASKGSGATDENAANELGCDPRPVCAHCKKTVGYLVARRLCKRCYERSDVRMNYPSVVGKPGGNYKWRPPVPNVEAPVCPLGPTNEQPGSEDKIEVMADRVRRGYSPFHPGDLNSQPDMDGIRTAGVRNGGRRGAYRHHGSGRG